jgi:hypothetical protein
MNKNILIGGIIFLVIAAAVVLKSGQKPGGSPSSSTAQTTIDACTLLTPETAATALGTEVELSTAPDTDVKIKNITVRSCTYSSKNPPTPKDITTVSLLVRQATDTKEAKTLFEESKRAFSGTDVAMMGVDGAFWTVTLQQLNILKGRDWLIIASGKYGKATQEQAIQTANLILPKL